MRLVTPCNVMKLREPNGRTPFIVRPWSQTEWKLHKSISTMDKPFSGTCCSLSLPSGWYETQPLLYCREFARLRWRWQGYQHTVNCRITAELYFLLYRHKLVQQTALHLCSSQSPPCACHTLMQQHCAGINVLGCTLCSTLVCCS